MRRVVVTGMGLLTPLGCGVDYVWDRLLNGVSAATNITRFDVSDYATSYACEIPFGVDEEGKFNPDEWMSLKERRKVDDFILYGVCAAEQAVKDAGWIPEKEEDLLRPYLNKYKNIKYEKLDDDPGLYGCWNRAIEISTGEYLTNANLDDRRALNQIEELARFLKYDRASDLVYTECYVTDKDGEDFYKNSSKGRTYSAKSYSRENMIKCLPGCMPLWRKSLHGRAGLFSPKFKSAGDWEMWLRAVRAGANFRKVETPLGMYYLNPKGLSTDRDAEKARLRHEEERSIFWEYTDIFGPINTALYKDYFSEG